jgi:hypothetical protein
MHTPIVVFATWASGSICHHWQSLHIPQSDAAIATAPLANRTPKNATSGRGEAVFGSERFFPATQSLPPPRKSSTVTIVKQHPYHIVPLSMIPAEMSQWSTRLRPAKALLDDLLSRASV